MRELIGTTAGRTAVAILLAIAAATVIAIGVLWPSGEQRVTEIAGIGGDTLRAEVIRVEEMPCPGPAPGEVCSRLEIELEDPPPGLPPSATVELGSVAFNPDFGVGDQVRVTASELEAAPPVPGEATPAAPVRFDIVDFERRAPILWLALAFAAVVVFFGRLRGALALSGLIGSLAIVLVFIVPAIRDGSEPVLVAVFGALAVMFVTISLAHGIGAKSAAAMLGTSGSLLLVAVLAWAFTSLAHLTGFSSEEATLLGSGGEISVQGLLLAGMVVGALGVLDDVTVSQASTVIALRSANPALRVGELYRRAIEVGRDHIAATVNTLVLAYAGAALPVLLIFSAGDVAFGEALNAEIVATEVVSMLVGSIGLIAAVPITTGLAAALAARLPAGTLAEEAEHAHAH